MIFYYYFVIILRVFNYLIKVFMSSINLLEKKLFNLSLNHEEKNVFSKTRAVSADIDHLIQNINKVVITPSSAAALKQSYESNILSMRSYTSLKQDQLDYLDLAHPLKATSTTHRLTALNLELPRFISDSFNPDAEKLYESLSKVEQKAHLVSLTKLLDLLDEGLKLYVYVTLDILSHSSFEAIRKESSVFFPRKTKFFVKEKLNDVPYHSDYHAHGAFGQFNTLYKKSSPEKLGLKIRKTTLSGLKKDQARNGLLNEAQALLQLDHPNIAKILAITSLGVHGEALFLEFLKGKTLEDHFKSLDFDTAKILKAARGIALGLSYIHSKGLVHKDIKPANIMILPDGTAKIFDLGLCRVKEKSANLSGSLCYIAPEAAARCVEAVDEKVDVYAFGVTLFEMLTSGKLPYPPTKDETRDAYLARLAKSNFRKPCCVKEIHRQLERDNLSLWIQRDPTGKLARLVVKCLHGDPKQRPSMQDIVSYLGKE